VKHNEGEREMSSRKFQRRENVEEFKDLAKELQWTNEGLRYKE